MTANDISEGPWKRAIVAILEYYHAYVCITLEADQDVFHPIILEHSGT
jgi:hypothetical protein